MKKMNHSKPDKICVIIPAYNEAFVIKEVVTGIKKQLDKHFEDYEVLVINDASTDDTSKKAQAGGARVINHVLNAGAGGATSTGIRYAKKNNFTIAAVMDADGQHKPEDVIKGILLSINGTVDLLIGSRLIDSEGMSRLKVLGNLGLSFVTRILFGIKSTDSQSGLRIFSRNAIENLTWKTARYEFCSEMLWRAHQKKMKVEEYPIQAIYSDYSKAKGQSNWNAFNIVKNLLYRRISEIFL